MKTKGTLSLSLSRSPIPRTVVTCTLIFLLCLGVGLLSGTFLKNNEKDTQAASASITVVDNNQVVTEDQGTTTIARTSTVTIKDPTATLGYTLSAQISQNTIPPTSAISIYSTSSTTCTQSSPCTLNTTTPAQILETTTNTATGASGHTTDWTVTITLPSTTPLGNYLLDIAYSEDPIIPLPAMQDFTTAQCSALALGTTIQLRDSRDDKVYRIRKMADNRCWMIDDLAYSLLQNDTGTTPNTGAPTFSPAVQVDTTPSGTPNLTSVDTQAQYAMNTTAYNIPNNGTPTPSYLYNWCAAMGDTSTNCATTVGYTAGQPSTPQTGICPTPFRLPTVGATPSPSTPGNGSNQATAAATTTNEFAKLDIWMGGTGTSRSNANTHTNFTTDNATNPQLFWLGVFGGLYGSGLGGQGSNGGWWSSTANSSGYAYYLNVYRDTYVYLSSNNNKRNGFAVRCLL